MKWSSSPKLTVVFAAALATLIANAIVSYRNTLKLIQNEQWVTHTHRVLSELESTLSTLKDAETGQRGYLLTRDEKFLEPYFAGLAQTDEHIAQLKQLTTDNPDQQQRIAQLEQKVNNRLKLLDFGIKLSQKPRFVPAQQTDLFRQGKQVMDETRLVAWEIELAETKLLKQRNQESRASTQKTLATFSIAILFDIALLILLYYFVHRDARERQRSEQALRESEARFRTMADTAPVMIWMSGRDRQRYYFNKGWLEFTGRSLEQELGNGWTAGIHPDDAQACSDTSNAAFKTQQDFRLEYRLRRFDGEYRWLLATGTPRFHADNSFAGYIGSCIDITERQQAEQKIREQAALLEVATDAIFVQDQENRILYWNKGAERLYGWQVDDAYAQNACELLYEEPALQIQPVQTALATKGEWQGELEQVTRDGKKIIVYSRWTQMRDSENKPKSILVVNSDITEKKKLEDQFLRTQRLESLGTLAGGIAHDLNNVLAPILMSLQLLELKYPEEKNQRLLNILEISAKRGAALVKQVLSFARGLEGKRTSVDVKHLIVEIEQVAKETFPKSIEIRTEIASDIWTVSVDATQLHQVLMNLVVNARDAMPNGGTLLVSAANLVIDEHYARMNLDAQPGSYIAITVADTGMGIPPEIKERIFEPFFTTKEIGKGTGLGLSTVIGIIKSHGGFINVYSEVNRGTRFKVYLPAEEDSQTQLIESLELLVGEGELVLVVDDEVAIREIAKASLETYNYRVMTANDGVEALALYAQHRDEIDVVLLDMMMPEMDSKVTIRTLQKINPQVKIIAISGLVANEKIAEAAGTGVKAFLSKPCTAKELLQTIRTVTSTKESE